MATHVGTSGLVKVGGTTVGEVIGFSINTWIFFSRKNLAIS